MTTQIEKKLVYVFLVVFFLLGVSGYVFIRDAEPKKIVMSSQAGTVIFDHVFHASVERAYECETCHHTRTSETEKVKICGKCHNAQKKGSELSRSDAFHGNCGECHGEVSASDGCNKCHKPTVTKDGVPTKIVMLSPSQGGKVVFDHALHASEEAADIDCDTCHHTRADETEKVNPCGKCHNDRKEGADLERFDAFHNNCGECHSEVEEDDSCDMCHKPEE